jgi:PadR family transcriptional regulator, regulatory protein PadR
MSEKNELVKTNIDSLLLCLIRERPMYGYQIIKELESRSQGYFKYKEGTLYPALHRLEKMELIEGKWRTLPSGQQRKYYNLTERGDATLVEKMDGWKEYLKAMSLIIQIQTESK